MISLLKGASYQYRGCSRSLDRKKEIIPSRTKYSREDSRSKRRVASFHPVPLLTILALSIHLNSVFR